MKLLLLSSLLFSLPADDPTERGVTLYAQGKYAEAVGAFREALNFLSERGD